MKKWKVFIKKNSSFIRAVFIACSVILILFAVSLSVLYSSKGESKMEYTISMEKPSTHYYHISFYYKGIGKDIIDCSLPVWTPGYYWITNFPKNIVNFKAENEDGQKLKWEKVKKNTWRINTKGINSIIVSYDVYAYTQSVADPFLDSGRGYISPAGVFMYVEGNLNHSVVVKVKPYKEWRKVSTGLDPEKGQANTFYASNFDVLYDSPILVGNQDVTTFDVKGIPHSLAIEFPKEFNIPRLVNDLKKIIEASSEIIGEIPYKHYTFIVMGEGRGGLEHSNSMAVFSSGVTYNPNDEEGYRRWLSFLAHEYFHLYNIKSIRPIALGPFDYSKENLTNMLWFSEGGTVYYEYVIMNRAGLMDSATFFDEVSDGIKRYENIPGHLFQSATESSFDTWIQFFNWGENAKNTTISYYDKGFAVCLLLDLKIRQETQSKKSLDDVMRTLYKKYYKAKKRGFTDKEFRKVCESIAECSLDELFNYASTTVSVDYQKYFTYAGLSIDTISYPKSEPWLGANIREDERLVISSVEWNSPAYNVGLSALDTILSVDGAKADKARLNEIIKSHRSGDEIKLMIANRIQKGAVIVKLGKKYERSFKITPLTNLSVEQSGLYKKWLKYSIF